MAYRINAKGTLNPSFSIGKSGATIYQGTALPDNSDGISGDLYLYINGSSSAVYQKQGSVWAVPSGSGSVTSIVAGTDLTGGTITSSGTINLATQGGLTAGTYQGIVVNAKGVITAATNQSYLTTNQNISVTGDVTGSGSTSIALTLGSVVTAGTYNQVVVGTKGLVTSGTNVAYLTTNQSITVSGDASGAGSTAITLTLGTSGVTAGTYGSGTNFPQIVVDAKGRVTSATTIALGSIASQGSNNVTITGGTITGLPTPTNAADAVNKAYVDAATAGLSAKASTRLSTTANLTATYANGTSGVNATLTLTGTGALSLDGLTVVAGDRVLVKDQSTALQNGIYTVTVVGASGTSAILTRATDFNSSTTVTDGAYVVIEEGSANKGTLWLVTNAGQTTYTIGTTAITFTELAVAPQTIAYTGDVTGTGAGTVGLTLATVNSNVGTFGNTTNIPTVTVNAKGLVTAISNTSITYGTGSLTSLVAGTDLTGGTITNTGTINLATSGVTAGTYQGIVVNNKGIVTSASNQSYGTGSVTSISITGGSGIGVSGSPITNTGTITLTLGTITPTTINMNGASGTADVQLTLNKVTSQTADFIQVKNGTVVLAKIDVNGSLTASNFSGVHSGTSSNTNTGDQTITLTGDVTGSGTGSFATTLATVNSNVGTFGNTTNIPTITVNAKGLITAISNTAITYGTGSVTSITTGTGLTGGTITNAGTIAMGTSGVTAGTYGNGSNVGQIVVDAIGRVTSSSNVAITPAGIGAAASGANTDITSVLLNQTGLVVKGATTNALTIKPNETLSAARTLNLVVGDTSRTLTFTADTTIGGTHSGVSSGTNTGDQTITLGGDVTTSGMTTGTFTATLGSVNANTGTFTYAVVGTKGLVTAAGNMTASGDATGTASGINLPLTLGTTGVTAGTYGGTTSIPQIVVDAKGRITSGTNISITTGGNTRTVTQTTHGFSVGNILKLSGTTYATAQADSSANAEVVGIVSSVVDANNFVLTTSGYVSGLSGLTAGSMYFLSASSAGTLTITEPSTSGQISKPVLLADSTTSGYFYNMRGEVIGASPIVSGSSLVGNPSSGTGSPTSITLGNGLSLQSNFLSVSDAGGFVNKIRNGGMDIWQRGTSITITAGTSGNAGSYAADGWRISCVGANSTVNRGVNGNPTQYTMTIAGNTGMTNTNVRQRIESLLIDSLNSGICTVQFKIFNNTGASITPTISINSANAQDDFSAVTSIVSAASLQPCANNSTTTCAYTFTNNGVSNGIEIIVDFGSVLNLNTKNVSVHSFDLRATPGWATGTNNNPPQVEFRHAAIEQVNCQRYLYVVNNTSGTADYALGFSGQAFGTTAGTAPSSATNALIPIPFPVTMRTAPTAANFSSSAANTFALTGFLNAGRVSASSITLNNTQPHAGFLNLGVTGGTNILAGQCTTLWSTSTAAQLIFSAEL